MYTQFFGLKHTPFSIAPDPRYLYMSERHREALAHLLYGLNAGGGFVLLTGEIGAGKTTVCRLFLEQIPPRCNVAYVFNPKQTVTELLRSVCDEFHVPIELEPGRVPTVKDYIDPLNTYLLATHSARQNNVLIIDEAQNLAPDVLEQLRLLTNLETSERKLLQIILIGQPELRDMLARPEMEQLAQRVIARFHLGALSLEETVRYIAHRLAVAGIKERSPFDWRGMRRIHQLARGIPRRINLLCDRALLGAYAGGKRAVDVKTITVAAREVFNGDPGGVAWSAAQWRTAAAALMAGALVVGGATLALERRSSQSASTSALAVTSSAAAKPAASGAAASAPSSATASASPATSSTPSTPSSASASGGGAAPGESSSSQSVQAAQSAQSASAADKATPARNEPIVLGSEVRDVQAAYRQLAALWKLELGEGNACSLARRQNVYCFRSLKGLPEIRQLDRPGIVTLHDDDDRDYYALLVGLSGDQATLRIGGAIETVTLNALAHRWRGEFSTFWRAPEGYRRQIRIGDRGPQIDWIATELAAIDGTPKPTAGAIYNDALSRRLREFQLAQGLPPDGVAGPQTLMRLAMAAGVSEPRLHGVEALASSRK